MSVHNCGRGCDRQIFVSSIGGAPVGMPGGSQYTTASLQCHGCGKYICSRCVGRPPALSPMSSCPSCGGQLSWPGVEPPGGFLSRGGGAGVATAGGMNVARSMAGPSQTNGAATFSFLLAIMGVFCCAVSYMATPLGCMGMMVNLFAICLGAIGLLKWRSNGVGMFMSVAGIVIGLVNLLTTVVLLGFNFYMMSRF